MTQRRHTDIVFDAKISDRLQEMKVELALAKESEKNAKEESQKLSDMFRTRDAALRSDFERVLHDHERLLSEHEDLLLQLQITQKQLEKIQRFVCGN